MPLSSFHEWLASRSQEPPQADRLATLIAGAGTEAAGISFDRLRLLCGLSAEVLQDILSSLVASGQIVMPKVGGRIVYRAAR